MLSLADHQLDVVAGRGFDHVVALLQAERHRLLDKDMLAGVAGVDSEAVMQLMAQHDRHCVDLVVGQQFGVRGVAFGDVIFLHVVAALLLEQIGDRDDLDVIEGCDGAAVGACDAAQPDDSDFQSGHICLALQCVEVLVLKYWPRHVAKH